MAAVATATATTQAGQAHRLPNRPNLVSVGTIVWLSSELMFFADLQGSAEEPRVAEALEGLRAVCEEVRVLGSYPAGRV